MEIFWRLAFGHFLSDFTFQSNYIAAWKRRSIWGMLVHVALHPLVYIVLTWPYINDIWVDTRWVELNGWGSIFLVTIAHFLEDEWRVWSMRRGAPDNFLFYAWDQVIHLVVLFALSPMSDSFVQSKWPILGCLFVLATHFATVTIYFFEKDIYGRDFPATEEKYISMLYRLGALLCFMLPGYWWMGLVFFMVGRLSWLIYKRRFDFSWTSYLLGSFFAIACGAAARYVVYYV